MQLPGWFWEVLVQVPCGSAVGSGMVPEFRRLRCGSSGFLGLGVPVSGVASGIGSEDFGAGFGAVPIWLFPRLWCEFSCGLQDGYPKARVET